MSLAHNDIMYSSFCDSTNTTWLLCIDCLVLCRSLCSHVFFLFLIFFHCYRLFVLLMSSFLSNMSIIQILFNFQPIPNQIILHWIKQCNSWATIPLLEMNSINSWQCIMQLPPILILLDLRIEKAWLFAFQYNVIQVGIMGTWVEIYHFNNWIMLREVVTKISCFHIFICVIL